MLPPPLHLSTPQSMQVWILTGWCTSTPVNGASNLRVAGERECTWQGVVFWGLVFASSFFSMLGWTGCHERFSKLTVSSCPCCDAKQDALEPSLSADWDDCHNQLCASGPAVEGGSDAAALHVSWQPPQSNHGAPVGCYTVEVAQQQPRGRSDLTWQLAHSGPSLSCMVRRHSIPGQPQNRRNTSVMSGVQACCSRCIDGAAVQVTGLRHGRLYSVRVRASNARGAGGWSAPATARTRPGRPVPPPPPTVSQVAPPRSTSPPKKHLVWNRNAYPH